jgi:hypothetical protein
MRIAISAIICSIFVTAFAACSDHNECTIAAKQADDGGVTCPTLPNTEPPTYDGGVCIPGQCLPQWGDCDGDPSNGCEAQLTKDPNCSTCGFDCGKSFGVCRSVGPDVFGCVPMCDLSKCPPSGNPCRLPECSSQSACTYQTPVAAGVWCSVGKEVCDGMGNCVLAGAPCSVNEDCGMGRVCYPDSKTCSP